jgi:AraC family transcriptional regulator of adaptative response / DNA-3-methyladenine glycosylase II
VRCASETGTKKLPISDFISREKLCIYVRKRRVILAVICDNRGMELNPDICYHAMLAHDARFDGLFFVGVRTTGIYCRPICTARTPHLDNCRFYRSAAAAERAGHRPCLRCRPELAPGNARVDALDRLAADIAGRIEDGALTDRTVTELAAEVGISARHLRRVVETGFGVSPIELAQTQRLLLAKRLLTDTHLPITEIAFASGFASVRRFNALFKARYRLNPTDLRRLNSATLPAETLICELAYRPPLDWVSIRNFLVSRASGGVECLDGERYVRTARVGKHQGWLAVESCPDKPMLRVEVSVSLAPVLLPTLARVKRLFDLNADPHQIADRLGSLAAANPGLRMPCAFDGFEMAVRAILGQQISVKAATTLAGRFAAAFGEPLKTPFPLLTHLAPTPESVAGLEVEQLTALGIVTARARSILALAHAVGDGSIALQPGANVETTLARLQVLPGIGEWTAQYIAMRALAWPDAFPHTDLGVLKAMGETNPKRVLEYAEQWRPWRAYATMQLWKLLEEAQDTRDQGRRRKRI